MIKSVIMSINRVYIYSEVFGLGLNGR